MLPIPFADDFLASSLLSLLLPVCLLIAIAVWYLRTVRHVPEETPTSSAALPGPEVVAAASESVDDVTPAGPPPGDLS